MSDSQRWFILCVFLIFGALVYLLEPILFPFLCGFLLAYLWDPVADRLEAKGCSRTLAVVIVFTLFTIVLALLLFLLIPMLGRQFDAFGQRIPLFFDRLDTVVFPWMESTLGVDPRSLDLQKIRDVLQDHWRQSGNIATQIITKTSASGLALMGWLANLVLIPVVLFYLLRDWDIMIAKIKSLLPLNIEPKVSRWAKECDDVLGAFIKGQLLVMVCLGVVYSIGLTFIGLDVALLIGMLAGLASIVPYMGFIVGIIAAAIAAYMQFHDVFHLLLVLGVFGVGQMLEGMVLTPLLVGDKIGLHPVAVIFAVMAGGQLFGFTGVLLALPIAAIIMVLLRHLHEGYLISGIYTAPHHQAKADDIAGPSQNNDAV